MDTTASHADHDSDQGHLLPKLMAAGFVCPVCSGFPPVEIRRGMPIRSKEGLAVGTVAAVVLDREIRAVTHILLGRLPEVSGYWLIPVGLVVEVRAEQLQLSISAGEVDALPRWHSP